MAATNIYVSPVNEASGWWHRYLQELQSSGISSTSREVIDLDSTAIVDEIDKPVFSEWPASRQRSGAVMGSVQSGKTASMIAVAAKSLDLGVEIVIFLAGTRTALWSQTMSRIHEQLGITTSSLTDRLFVPDHRLVSSNRNIPLSQMYSLPKGQVARALELKRPIIICAMKQVSHLEALAKTLHEDVYPEVARAKQPVRLIVIDDEADDSSVDGAGADLTLEYRQIPRRILDLWESRTVPGATHNEYLFATYLAYTATPQANFLLDRKNVLHPRDFVVALRTPYDTGDIATRSGTYWVPEQRAGWYTGGEVYYKRLAPVPICMTPQILGDVPECSESAEYDGIIDSLRGFLVASALRLIRNPGKLSPVSATKMSFHSKIEAKTALPEVSSMLVHPSARMEKHFEVREAILKWSNGSSASPRYSSLSTAGIELDMEKFGGRWRFWVETFAIGSKKVDQASNTAGSSFTPGYESWQIIKDFVLHQIVPATNVEVINSDPSADDRPSFGITQDPDDGRWHPPANLSTIFVSGSVMSRGLTLEGLLMTSFGRSTGTPTADTQMQMQRWFGYRGSYIDLCRVILSENQLKLFEDYHEADEMLRARAFLQMQDQSLRGTTIPVLQGSDFLATGKIKPLRSQSLDPGPQPFARLLNSSTADKENQDLVADLFRNSDETLMVGPMAGRSNHPRGLITDRTFSLTEIASLLDQLSFESPHGNSKSSSIYQWGEIEKLVGIDTNDPNFPLYRGKQVDGQRDCGSVSPYDIAAYLRFWESCLDRNPLNVVSSGFMSRKWALYPRDERHAAAPRFRVALRFGSGSAVTVGSLAELDYEIKSMVRSHSDVGLLTGSWGTRGTDSAVSDEFFDLYTPDSPGLKFDVNERRAAGQPGLLMFYPVERSQGSISLAFGLSIPAGGPDLHLATKAN